jgi:ATP-dependent DNA helicase RecQ
VADATIVALKVLSCVLRASEQLGREKIAKILAGSKDSSIQNFRTLSTYGILTEHSIGSIVGFIDFLIAEGFIDPGDGYRPVIRVTEKGREFIKTRTPIEMPQGAIALVK